MTGGDVILIMGQPHEREVIILENGKSIEFLKYLVDYDLAGPILNADIKPICLLDDKVVGLGHDFCNKKKKELEIFFSRK